jgi:NhaP-type Na+/H+ or K+/H+ antiporter
MIRGVIAFALCLQIESNDKKFITTVALVIVIITTMLGSTLFKVFIQRVGLLDKMDKKNEEEEGFLGCRTMRNYK